ncbi:aldolase [Mesorhizobium sp. DCY119]|uniref:3-oxo-tetronate 4-phosphate decarboxylase n=1 Tax=Mesorhizobium sp. DCY119 TaxID=2108445 RepID=UPI000E70829F|nr:aldolase [Mesorhizobium sp. DCY119]RJG41397.1 aldolase [Mesorhizobium sp. DCY119]
MSEEQLRNDIVKWGRSLFERGLTAGSSGNISVRLEDGYLTTPTNSCLGFLDPDRLSRLDVEGRPVSGDAPTKELPLHFAFYEQRPKARAVVHLHSAYATALSCLSDVDVTDAIPPITPYVVMRVGRVPVVAYTRPGSPDIKPLIQKIAGDHAAALLQNHGPIVAGNSLDTAVFAIEELEEAAKLLILTRSMSVRTLDPSAIADLNQHFKLK